MKKYIFGFIVGVSLATASIANARVFFGDMKNTASSETIQTQEKIPWVYESYFTIENLMTALNALPVDKQLEAKIMVINSQRSMLGAWSDPYYLIHR